MSKKKLTIAEQIVHMKDVNGIHFNIVNEVAAKDFLTNNNYYFKIKSYAKNFEKYAHGPNAGKYLNLEFAYLQELSTIDMYLRKSIIRLTLDLEHALKTQLLRDASENDCEDGYDIVNEFLSKYTYVVENIDKKKSDAACRDLIGKYECSFAIWNIVEVLSFGDFIRLYETYYKKYPSKNSTLNHLWSVKFLRNAAAHNTCLLNNLRRPYKTVTPNKRVEQYISRILGIGKTARQHNLKHPLIHDIAVCLYAFDLVIKSKAMKMGAFGELKVLFDERFVKHKDYFQGNDMLRSHYQFLKLVIDHFYAKAYNNFTEQKH